MLASSLLMISLRSKHKWSTCWRTSRLFLSKDFHDSALGLELRAVSSHYKCRKAEHLSVLFLPGWSKAGTPLGISSSWSSPIFLWQHLDWGTSLGGPSFPRQSINSSSFLIDSLVLS